MSCSQHDCGFPHSKQTRFCFGSTSFTAEPSCKIRPSIQMARKCFISFKTEDVTYKLAIQNNLRIDMVDKSLDAPIDSTDEDYIMQQIRKDYLSDSTVTIHLIGEKSAEQYGAFEQRFIK